MPRSYADRQLQKHAWQVGPCGRRLAGIGVLLCLVVFVFQLWATIRDWNTVGKLNVTANRGGQSAPTVKTLAIFSLVWLPCSLLLCVWIQAQIFVGWLSDPIHSQYGYRRDDDCDCLSEPQAFTTLFCVVSGLGVAVTALAYFIISWNSGVYLPRCPMEYFPFACEVVIMLAGVVLVLVLIGLAFYGIGYCFWHGILVHLCSTDTFVLWCPCVQRAWRHAVASAIDGSRNETGVIAEASAPPYQSITKPDASTKSPHLVVNRV